MTSTLILYKNCNIIPDKLFIVDSIATYLGSLSNSITITKFQYIRQGLRISVDIDRSQTALDFTSANNYNYCSIQDGSEKICYYFIMNKKQIASSTIRLELEMDTINTFKPSVDFTITNKTTINRQHKDRYYTIGASTKSYPLYGTGKTAKSGAVYRYTYTYTDPEWIGKTMPPIPPSLTINTSSVGMASYSFDSTTGTLQIVFQSTGISYTFSFSGTFSLIVPTRNVRKIDLISEGITPILYGENIAQINPDNLDWYLVYVGTSTITALACPSSPITIYVPGSSSVAPNNLSSGNYYYLMEDRTSGDTRVTCYVTTSNGNKYDVGFDSVFGLNATKRVCCVFYTDGTSIYIRRMVYYKNPAGFWVFEYDTDWETCTSLTLKGISVISHILTSYTTSLSSIYGGSTYTFTITGGAQEIKSFSSLSRTATDLVKIIKLPYAPLDITEVSPDWSYNSTYGMLQMYDPDIRLESIIYDDNNPLDVLNIDLSSISTTQLRNATYESKLYHSDYYQPKFIYDSFTKVFALERINLSSYEVLSTSPFKFHFVCTNTINSKFVFYFTQYTTDGKAFDDFEDILVASRNNEMVIYNSEYLNYIKNGFNYDVKTKNRQEAGQWIGVGLSLVGAVASFASVGVTKGFGIAGGISLATTAMAQLTNAVNSTAQAEATQNQKLLQLRQQKDSVYGADDVDLMSYYCNNKAKLMLYQCSSVMKQTLYDLFFYTGYICGYKGIPDMTGRFRFNFVSCELELEGENTLNIPEEILKDIKIKYSAGVTFLHYRGEYDWEQQYENWEMSLF